MLVPLPRHSAQLVHMARQLVQLTLVPVSLVLRVTIVYKAPQLATILVRYVLQDIIAL